jgi:hypothetical protein
MEYALSPSVECVCVRYHRDVLLNVRFLVNGSICHNTLEIFDIMKH